MAATKKTAEAKKTEEKKTTAVKAAAKPAAKKAAPAKTAAKAAPARKAAEIIVQSPMGGNITTEEILAKVGKADKIYVRVDENKAYWVRGKETGSVDLWD